MALNQLEKMNMIKYLKSNKSDCLYVEDFLSTVKRNKNTYLEVLKFLIEYVNKKLDGADVSFSLLEKIIKTIDSFVRWAYEDNLKMSSELVEQALRMEEKYHLHLSQNDKEPLDDVEVALEKLKSTIGELYKRDESQLLDDDKTQELVKSLTELKKSLDTKIEEVEYLRKEIATKDVLLVKKENGIVKLKNEKMEQYQKVVELESSIHALEKEITRLKNVDELSKQAIADLEKELEKIRKSYQELLTKYNKLKEDFSESKKVIKNIEAKEKEELSKKSRHDEIKNVILSLLCNRKLSLTEITNYVNDLGYRIKREEVYDMLMEIDRRVNLTSNTLSIPPKYSITKPEVVVNGCLDISNFIKGSSCDFLFISDIHFNNYNEDVKRAYDAVYEYAISNGINVVFNTGDLFNAAMAFKTEANVVDIGKALRCVDNYATNVPYDKNIYQAILGANHERLLLNFGIDPLAILSRSREDLIHLGYDHCRIEYKNSKRLVVLHHPKTRIPESMSEEGYNVSYLLSYLNDYYLREKLSRDDTYIDFIAHFHKSMADLENSFVVIPSLIKDRVFNGAWRVKVYFNNNDIENMVFIPLILMQDKLSAVCELPYRKVLTKE